MILLFNQDTTPEILLITHFDIHITIPLKHANIKIPKFLANSNTSALEEVHYFPGSTGFLAINIGAIY